MQLVIRHQCFYLLYSENTNNELPTDLLDGAITCTVVAWLSVPALKLLSNGGWHMLKRRRKCFICPCHLSVYIMSSVSCRARAVLLVCSTVYRPCVTYLLDCSSCTWIVHVLVLFVSDSVKPLPRILCRNVIKYPCPNLSDRSSIVYNLQVHSCLAYPYRAASWLEVEASKRKSQERKVCSQVVQHR